MKKCVHNHTKNRFTKVWRLLTCSECRQNRRADAHISTVIQAFRNSPLPPQGLEYTLKTVQNTQGGMPFSVELVRKRNRLLSPAYMRVYGVIGCGLIVTGGLAFREMNTNPTVNIPTPTMPAPNAYTYYYEAGVSSQALKKESREASEMDADLHNEKVHLPKYSPQQRAELLAKFTPSLTRLRDGFQYDYMNPPVRSTSQLMPHLATFRNLARIMALESDVYADQADWEGAINSRLDTLYLGRECPKGGSLIAGLVGSAIQAIGRAHTQPIIENLSGEEAQKAAKRMERILAEETSYAQILREESWAMQASILELFQTPNWRVSFVNMMGSGENIANDSWTNRLIPLGLLFVNKRASMQNIRSYMDALIAQADLPYQKNKTAPPVPNDIFCRIMLPVFDQAGFVFTKNQTENRLMLTALALQAYRAERKAYPASLQELVNRNYLSEIPKDPFALAQPLHYVKSGASYLLYSVGPDGIDDNGKPGENPDMTPSGENKPHDASQKLHQIVPNSKGDCVYQINTR